MGKVISCCIMCLTGLALNAATYRVQDYDSFNKAQQLAAPGDSLIWQNGTYQNVVLDILKNRLFFYAEEPGGVVFSGRSSITIFSDSVLISGFQFKDGNTEGDILKVAGSHVTIEHLNFSKFSSHYYLNILPGAQYNQVRNCNFEKKPEDRTTSVFQIQAHPELPGYHHVSHCSFQDFSAPPDAGGDYGIEALRIGYSFQSHFVGRNIVEYCYFTKCNGDGEIISSKARENIYRYNTFADNNESHFTLRHGSDNVVYSNFFLRGAGIRIKEGQNHMVYNNYFQTGRWFSVRLMNHPADPLDNIIIANNSFASSGPILGGRNGDHQPKNVALVNNLFIDPSEKLFEGFTGMEFLSGNESNVPTGVNGIKMNAKIDFMVNTDGLIQLQKLQKGRGYGKRSLEILDIPSLDDDPQLQLDIMKQNRPEKMTAGCYEPSGSVVLRPYATTENTGPVYLKSTSGNSERGSE